MTPYTYLPSFPLAANPVLLFGLLLISGFAGGELVQRMLGLPRIVGYVLVGLVLGVSGFGLIDARLAAEAQMFVNIGLGIVVFELGRRLDFDWLRRDRWFAAAALAESVLSFAFMYAALAYFDIAPVYAAAAAAIGVATSPAIVLLVAQEVRAEGQVTERALNLVAINSVAAFVVTTMLLSWLHHEYRASLLTVVLHPAYLLGGSLVVGYIASWAAILLARWIRKREELQLVMLLGLIVIAVGFAYALNLSVMLSLLVFGLMSRNLDAHHELMQISMGRIGQIFFVVLFVVTGATLDVTDLMAGGLTATAYIVARFAGKAIGVLSFAHFSGIRPGSGGLLCLALTPMSAFAIEVMQGTSHLYPDFGARLGPTVLSAVLLLELIGPVAVQFALTQAGEAQEERK